MMANACGFREGEWITSDEGKSMGEEMWKKVMGILRENVPRVDDILQELK
jgi:hypothetical protein